MKKARCVVLFVLILQKCLPPSTNAMFDRKTLKVDRFVGVCPKYRNLTILLQDATFRNIDKYLSMNAKFVVLKDTSNDMKFRVMINRCRAKEALDSCEPYPDLNISQMCMAFNALVPPFNGFLAQIHPKLSCPFKKGVYKMINGSIDQTSLAIFPIDGWYWKVYVNMLEKMDDEYKIMSCSYIEGSVIHV